MPVPICVSCRVEYRCQQNDFLVNDIEAGVFPRTYWLGDKFQCPVCNSEIVVGFGREISEESLKRFGEIDFDPSASLTFAHEPRQITQFADQFHLPHETD